MPTPADTVRSFIDEIFVRGDHEAVDRLTTEDFTAYTFGPTPTGRAELSAAIDRVHGGLSDVSMRIEELIEQGDRVAVRLSSAATQTGTFMGVPPTGKRYEIEEAHFFVVRDGRVAEHRHVADFFSLMRQLGALPGGGS